MKSISDRFSTVDLRVGRVFDRARSTLHANSVISSKTIPFRRFRRGATNESTSATLVVFSPKRGTVETLLLRIRGLLVRFSALTDSLEEILKNRFID